MAYKKSNPNSQASSANSEPVVLSTEQEAKIDLLATKAKQDLLLTELQLKADLTETQPVSIAGTVAVSGPLTDAQLRATAVPVSGTFWQATQPVSGTFFQATQPVSAASLPLPTGAATETTLSGINTKTPALGQAVMASSTPVVIASNQTAIPVSVGAASVLFKGRASTFRTPGRAGTAGQNIMSIHNATGSAVTVTVNKVVVDLYQTVVKAITVPPPNIRIWKVTVLPTNGTALAKTKIGGTTTSSASVDVRGDASADGTGSATTLTTTRPAGTFIGQKFASRNITAAGYEIADTIEFLDGSEVTLSALEGLVVFLDYTVATMNPVTDMWTAVVEWSES